MSAIRLDEIKRDVLSSGQSVRPRVGLQPLRKRFLAFGLFVTLFGISTSNAAAGILNFVSAGTLGKNVGNKGFSSGTQYMFGSYHWGGDKSDDAGHETYCPDDDKSSDDRDGSSSDNSDKDKYSDDRDKSSGDKSDDGPGHYSGSSYKDAKSGGSHHPMPDDECDSSDKSSDRSSDKSSEKSDDNDKSSGDHSDERSDDNDKSSGDKSDGDKYSDDKDGSSDDKSDEKSDDNDGSSGDYSD